MDQRRMLAEQFNNLISSFLENPGRVNRVDADQLEKLLEEYPYSQLLHFIYAASMKEDHSAFQRSLSLASAYAPQREVLYNIIQQPDGFKYSKGESYEVTTIHNSDETGFLTGSSIQPPARFEEAEGGVLNQSYEDNRNAGLPEDLSSDDPIFASVRGGDISEYLSKPPQDHTQSEVSEEADAYDEPIEEISEVRSPYETDDVAIVSPDHNAFIEVDERSLIGVDEPNQEISEVANPYETEDGEISSPDQNTLIEPDERELDEEEPMEEISEVTGPYETSEPKTLSPEHNTFVEVDERGAEDDEPIEEISEAPQADPDPVQKVETEYPSQRSEPYAEEEKDEALQQDNLIGSIAGSDFFAFEKSVVDPLQSEGASRQAETKQQRAEQNVSRYNDDKLPYTFLWWLNKTRKEHADTYQPYANFSLDTTQSIRQRAPVEELNHQIIENIFHLKTPLDDLEPVAHSATVEFELKRKEDVIIDKFIKEEPQIKPPQLEKLDTENKARRSAEDPNDLVSETLARIYTDQMLYPKAIDTYKKLSLKFPEKSTFFANQISELEKKIN